MNLQAQKMFIIMTVAALLLLLSFYYLIHVWLIVFAAILTAIFFAEFGGVPDQDALDWPSPKKAATWPIARHRSAWLDWDFIGVCCDFWYGA